MNPANANTSPKVTAELVAEAAAWLAVLHGPNRTQATERGFAQWVKRSPGHARAFEEATAIWEEARALPRPGVLRAEFGRTPPGRRLLRAAAMAAALTAVVAGGLVYVQRQAGVTTGVGEQRVVALDDGSRVILNTDTRVVVAYSDTVRRIDLKAGEALFEVAQEAARPFVVNAGERTIRALGTSFVVRRDAERLAVTLVEGRVAVSPAAVPPQAEAAVPDVVLKPGERAVFTPAEPVAKDRPELDRLLAWQRREVAFDNAALADAVAEMNRYNRKPLVVEADAWDHMNVTGLFRAGDSLSFARAVAEAYALQVVDERERIVLR